MRKKAPYGTQNMNVYQSLQSDQALQFSLCFTISQQQSEISQWTAKSGPFAKTNKPDPSLFV